MISGARTLVQQYGLSKEPHNTIRCKKQLLKDNQTINVGIIWRKKNVKIEKKWKQWQ